MISRINCDDDGFVVRGVPEQHLLQIINIFIKDKFPVGEEVEVKHKEKWILGKVVHQNEVNGTLLVHLGDGLSSYKERLGSYKEIKPNYNRVKPTSFRQNDFANPSEPKAYVVCGKTKLRVDGEHVETLKSGVVVNPPVEAVIHIREIDRVYASGSGRRRVTLSNRLNGEITYYALDVPLRKVKSLLPRLTNDRSVQTRSRRSRSGYGHTTEVVVIGYRRTRI